jgi:hypothetical protein
MHLFRFCFIKGIPGKTVCDCCPNPRGDITTILAIEYR